VPLYAYDELIAEAERDEAAESCRLAYVAATRAQDHLILSGCYAPDKVADPVPEDELPAGTPVSERLLRALEVTEPEDGFVELAPPRPRPGLEARFAPARLALEVNRSEAGRQTTAAHRPVSAGARVRPSLLLGARRLRALRISLLHGAHTRDARP
jgi:ATP-dependent exoDNAse (exonuclease V) beta subunit